MPDVSECFFWPIIWAASGCLAAVWGWRQLAREFPGQRRWSEFAFALLVVMCASVGPFGWVAAFIGTKLKIP